MAVTVLGDNTVSVAIVDATAISVDVGEAPQTGVDAYGGIGPTIVVSGTHTAFIGSIGINPFVAGPNIAITQSAGNIIVSGLEPLTRLGATSPGGDLVTLADDVEHVDGRISAVINQLPGGGATQGVPLVVVSSDGRIRTASSYVASVNGRTGTITLNAASVTAVSSVQGKTGVVTLVAEDIAISIDGYYIATDDSVDGAFSKLDTAISGIAEFGVPAVHPPIIHTHSTASITSFASAVRAIGNVVDVNGKTGSVTLSQADIASTLGNSDLAEDLVELQSSTSAVEAKFPTSSVPSGRVLTASNDGPDGTFRIKAVPGYVYSIAGCTGTVTLVQGANITLTPNTTLSRITIASTGGGGGGGAATAIWPALILGG